jgi:hypothetical protein
MIKSELLAELTQVSQNFDWTYLGSNRKIRARLMSEKGDGPLFDLIGAVCFVQTGIRFSEEEWLKAADHMNLSHIDAADLVASSNNVSLLRDEAYLRNLRREIIESVSLRPESVSSLIVTANRAARYLTTLLREEVLGAVKKDPVLVESLIPSVGAPVRNRARAFAQASNPRKN